MDICQVDGCSNEVLVKSRGLCKMHYHRVMRTGGTGPAGKVRSDEDASERWMRSVSVESPGCWIWTGSLDKHGYGQFDVTTDGKRKNWRAHRWVYTVLVRPLEPRETLDHLCRVHACVNPDHVEPASHAVNVGRGHAGARYKNRDFCKHGHPFTPENTRMRGAARECLACERIRNRARYLATKPDAKTYEPRTHCEHGHEFTPENTHWTPTSGRRCRACNRERVAAYRAAAKAERERQRA